MASSNGIYMKGWLLKWTNYIKGYQRRWFVLSNGVLSYYRNQAEMAHTCRGTINLLGALIYAQDEFSFIISNGTTQSFYLKASSEIERQQWITALELAKTKAIDLSELTDEVKTHREMGPYSQLLQKIDTLGSQIENLQTCYDLIVKHGNDLVKSLSQIEKMETLEEAMAEVKDINKQASLFRVTSNAMINSSKEYLHSVQIEIESIHNILSEEENHRKQLEELVDQLIAQYSILEKAALDKRLLSEDEISQITLPKQIAGIPESDGQFFDALDSSPADYPERPGKESPDLIIEHARRASVYSSDNVDVISITGSGRYSTASRTPYIKEPSRRKKVKRRCRIPDRPQCSVNLWSVMKNCIGKDLSKIPMPVNFSEPLSLLQRIAEDFAYSDLLNKAATCDDCCEQIAYVAAFIISNYSTTAIRSAKPFNPLLGETYELDRMDDLGWRLISEQVSHHPPMAAQYCESSDWTFWQEFTMSSKFRGKYLQVVPLGIAHLIIHKDDYHYTWRKVTTTVHNIIVGKLWVDQQGETDVINHSNGIRCRLTFLPFSYFKSESQRRVKGYVFDKEGVVTWIISGTWDKEVQIAPVTNIKGTKDNPIYDTGEYVTVWTSVNPCPGSEKYYNFSLFACQLNEMEEGVAPTDSRRRPDQRLMEEGKWDEANVVKIALEEKQRAARKAREKMIEKGNKSSGNLQNTSKTSKMEKKESVPNKDEDESEMNICSPYEPIWFKKELDPITGNIIHMYNGGYWEAKENKDWHMCPDIYL